jgi:hypothetical protein
MSVEVAPLRPLGLYVATPLWLAACGYLSYAYLVPGALGGDSKLPPAAYLLLFWPIAGYLVYLTLWSAAGAEVLSVAGGELAVERRLFGRTIYRRSYRLAEIEELRLDPRSWWVLGWHYPFSFAKRSWGFGVGPVVFDYGGREVRIAEGLRGNDADSERLLIMLRQALASGVQG